jgi:hypothetical protein
MLVITHDQTRVIDHIIKGTLRLRSAKKSDIPGIFDYDPPNKTERLRPRDEHNSITRALRGLSNIPTDIFAANDALHVEFDEISDDDFRHLRKVSKQIGRPIIVQDIRSRVRIDPNDGLFHE